MPGGLQVAPPPDPRAAPNTVAPHETDPMKRDHAKRLLLDELLTGNYDLLDRIAKSLDKIGMDAVESDRKSISPPSVEGPNM